jgi:DNA excision repair protein ERCC-2
MARSAVSAAPTKPVYSVQVRELVAFALRRGDLGGGEGDFVGPGRALAGTRGHQRLQRSRPAGYQKEVRVSHEVDAADFVLRIQGRIDGLLVSPDEVLLEEIKTVQGAWDRAADPLHWAQAKIYAFIYARQNGCDAISIRLTYLDLDSGEVTEFREPCPAGALAAFFDEKTAIYLDWMRDWHRWRVRRDQSLGALGFPFAAYRPGQRDLAVAVYRLLEPGGRLFLEAPTGIGKTISVLFPAVKALGEGKLERLFYLTARTSGRAVAEKALNDLRAAGLRLRSLTLTAREKVCLQNGSPCDPRACPLALGYYDRLIPAMREALAREEITRAALAEVGAAHRVCPHELSLDLSAWVDAVICDYNYVFDPKVYLRRQFADDAGDYAFLVDEAHNLVDRARDMFSADLETREVNEVRRALGQAVPACAKSLRRLANALRRLAGSPEPEPEPAEAPNPPAEPELFPDSGAGVSPALRRMPTSSAAAAEGAGPAGLGGAGDQCRPDLPPELLPHVENAMSAAESWLALNQPSDFRPELLQLYFRLHSFCRTADLYDESYATIIEPGKSTRVRLFCVDPSSLLRQALERGKAAVFFSATLTPLEYYRTLLGGDERDPVLQLPSPFPPGNLAVLVQDRIRTQLKARSATLDEVAGAIAALVAARVGNYLVYLPSYQYLAAVRERFQARCPRVQLLAQKPGMTEPEREAFLEAFSVEHGQTLVGFAVLGGVFAEGIDLVGDRLIGAVIVGVGLPQLCLERDLIRHHFEAKTSAGFEFAYAFPGMNRVLQAAGRVIRSESDRGAILLIDARFGEPRYRRLFPACWRPLRARSAAEIAGLVTHFWSPAD